MNDKNVDTLFAFLRKKHLMPNTRNLLYTRMNKVTISLVFIYRQRLTVVDFYRKLFYSLFLPKATVHKIRQHQL